MPDPTDPPEQKSFKLISQYRDRLKDILKLAELDCPVNQQEARRRVAALIDELTRDIVALYDCAASNTLSRLEESTVLPGLKRLRDILRNSKSSRRGLRDTVRKAADTNALLEQRVS